MRQVETTEFIHKDQHCQPEDLMDDRPCVLQDGDCVTLQFQRGEIQSRMLASDPNSLVISYTQAMAAFRLFHPMPRRVAMIGLGGGSLAKWCYHQFSVTDITVVEINAQIIALRERFHIPTDDDRFRVICGDGADYVASASDSPDVPHPDVLLVDGFDQDGQASQLCSRSFYRNCHRALAADGLLVVNLCGTDEQRALRRIRRYFNDRVLIITPEDGENKIVFAWKGKRLRIDDAENDEAVKMLLTDYVAVPFIMDRF